MLRRRSLSFLAPTLLVAISIAAADWDTHSDTWAATDGLGRAVAESDTAGGPRAGRLVAVFYYIWHGQHGTGLYDITKIRAADADNPTWGPRGAFHHWAEPLYGYYIADDEWVIRKNAQMLTDAGVDAIFFDVTNAVTYTSVYLELCRVYREIRGAGGRTPQIAFLTNSSSGRTAQRIYDDLYAKGLYRELWFRWQGKPIILAKSEELSPELRSFFTVRRSWAWQPGKDRWPWLEHLPQQGGWHERPDLIEQMVVETAQHPTSHNGGLGLGKSCRNGVQPPPGQYRSEQGHYFGEHWQRALDADPQLIFVTQWNEWIAQRFIADKAMTYAGNRLDAGDSYFVDVFSMEFNRDIEPMRGGYEDNYYYQMVDGIRRFKGARPLPPVSAPKCIEIDDFSDWDDVEPEYRDDIGDIFHRDHPGYGGQRLANRTGRNDIKIARVARDSENVYFYVETANDLSGRRDSDWMTLFIRIEARGEPSWQGWHYRVQPVADAGDAELVVRRSSGGWHWETLGSVQYRLAARQLALKIPRASLGLESGQTDVDIRFKWSDNMQDPDPTDWIINGDVAPNGRFQYRYPAAQQP